MRREVLQKDLEKLYTASDMAKVGCGNCEGCWECCQGMGESVILDPLDVYRLEKGLGKTFPELMQLCMELGAVDGVVLPHLRMEGAQERCVFLSEENRCSVHAVRPGFCRMFPLGRYYQDGSFRYFLQHQECPKEPKTKVKISRWLDTQNLKQYENYIMDWHDLQEEAQQIFQTDADGQLAKDLNVYLLETFYSRPYDDRDFYEQFSERLVHMKKLIRILKK